jgi:hypothetical protein
MRYRQDMGYGEDMEYGEKSNGNMGGDEDTNSNTRRTIKFKAFRR